MNKKFLLVIGLTIITIVILYSVHYIANSYELKLGTIPYTKAQILDYLEDRYKEKFNIEPLDISEEKDRLYVAYPINNSDIKFYVYDEYKNPTIGFNEYKGAKRELHNTYTNSLLLQDLINIRNIYSMIKLDTYTDLKLSTISWADYEQNITLEFNNNYEEIDDFIDKYKEVYSYIKNNKDKYKAVDTKIIVKSSFISTDINDDINIDNLKEELLSKLVKEYRETNNDNIYKIPANIKSLYKVFDIGYTNKVSKIYVNNNEVSITTKNGINMQYLYKCLQVDIYEIFELIPELKNKLHVIDYSNFNNINSINEDILFAYEKDNNKYIVTKVKNGLTMNLYKYENNDITKINWNNTYNFLCNDDLKTRLKEYFNIEAYYDFDKEILYFNY